MKLEIEPILVLILNHYRPDWGRPVSQTGPNTVVNSSGGLSPLTVGMGQCRH